MVELIGNEKYGGWYTETGQLREDSVVYSFGIGEDVTWDLEIIKKFGCNVCAFDPTPRVVEWVKTKQFPPEFKFNPIGISDFDGVASFEFKEGKLDISVNPRFGTAGKMLELPVKRLATIMSELGHDHVDVLKMDIEGAEYLVLPDIVGLNVKQLLFETHERFFVGWKGLKPLYGKWKTHQLQKILAYAGFKLAHEKPIGEGAIDKDYLFLRFLR